MTEGNEKTLKENFNVNSFPKTNKKINKKYPQNTKTPKNINKKSVNLSPVIQKTNINQDNLIKIHPNINLLNTIQKCNHTQKNTNYKNEINKKIENSCTHLDKPRFFGH